MKRLIVFLVLVVTLISLPLFGLADTMASIADTPIPGNEAATSASEAGNPDSANATITIIMRTRPLPGEFEKPEP